MKEKITKNYNKMIGDRKRKPFANKSSSVKLASKKRSGCGGCSRKRKIK